MPQRIPDEWIRWMGDPSDAAERLLEEERGSEMLPARLASLISAISEQIDHASWSMGMDLELYRQAVGAKAARILSHELNALRHAADLLDGGWVAWDPALDGPALFTRDEWRSGEGCPLN